MKTSHQLPNSGKRFRQSPAERPDRRIGAGIARWRQRCAAVCDENRDVTCLIVVVAPFGSRRMHLYEKPT
ncbi:hypothetical protein [Pelagibius sp. Alg239-R121]|uniref:hypothetical protein n=1 Tax=Pelagibius sp. Alg239-R121 TaxID=2993448 RepID=UPI0024A6432F|nr:hypothetical protein [Pelagibius sp. Alg239-R121]